MKKVTFFLATVLFAVFGSFQTAYPHCDTMDGPVIVDAKMALKNNNVNYVLKWVRLDDENEIKNIFDQAVKVRQLNADAKVLADKYFFENLVRIHRAGEGVPFTGIKPSGTPINEIIQAADKAIETGNLETLEKLVPREKRSKLNELFRKAVSLKNFDVNNVKAGREYIEAYVHFFHFAEGEEGHKHGEHAGHLAILIPIMLSIILFLATVFLGISYFRIKRNR